MHSVRNNGFVRVSLCAALAALIEIAMPVQVLAAPAPLAFTITVSAALKGGGKDKPEMAVKSKPVSIKEKPDKAPVRNKRSKSSFSKKEMGKDAMNVMRVIRGSQQALRFYPKDRELAVNARVCLKKGAGFLTFQRKAGGMVTYGDGGCNVLMQGGPANDKKSGGTWSGP
ncbi:MAG: hypothetical protein WAT93_00470 [Pontixanthobacter sp.]